MVRHYKKKAEGARLNYSDSTAMAEAYNSVMRSEMSSNQAAKYYGVNKKSLLRRVRGEIPINAHVGRSSVLSPDEELELEECLKLLADWGWGFNKSEVQDLIQQYCNHREKTTPFKDNHPGRDWLEGFLMRHPSLAPRKTEQLSSARARAQDPEVVQKWFQLLDTELTKAGVKGLPEQIFNVDESGFVTDPKTDIVLARKGAKRVNQAIGGSGREQITVNCGGSAAGVVLPPYVVYKGKNLYHEWTQGGPERTSYTTSEKGWMEGPQFLDWFNKFLRETDHLKHNTRVLICDGHASHLTLPMITTARANNVVILRLPAHLTHLLQPFDRSVFRPVKLYWQQLLREHARTHSGPVSKKAFPSLLKKLYDRSFTPDQLKAGFRACGIFPFNASVVPAEDLAPSPFISSAASDPAVLTTLSATPPLPSNTDTPAPSSTSSSNNATTAPSPSASNDAPAPSTSSDAPTAPAPEHPKTIRDFFLQRLQPRFSGTNGRGGRSKRVQRFRYGESLTSDECAERLHNEESKKTDSSKSRRGGRRGKKSTAKKSLSVDGDLDLTDSVVDDTPCHRCEQCGGDRWISCDLCDEWYHMDCVGLTCSLKDMEDEEWMCNDCTQ